MQLPNQISPAEVQQHINTVELKKQLNQQILKDLGIEDWQLSAEAPNFFTQLKSELFYTIQAIIERQPQLLPNIIYRIDLSEPSVREILNNPEKDAAEVLAEMILHREMKKVFYRNVYNGNITL